MGVFCNHKIDIAADYQGWIPVLSPGDVGCVMFSPEVFAPDNDTALRSLL